MSKVRRRMRVPLVLAVAALSALALAGAVSARQRGPLVLEGDDLTRVVPTGFFFEKQSAPTQMRNASAVQWGRGERARYVIAGLVDTSGYSSEVRAKYQGFFINDTPVMVGGRTLPTGAYGFGFTGNGRLRIFDVSGRQVLTAPAFKDSRMQRPRPLMFTTEYGDVRLYSGRDYAVISAR
ncbi:MAG TPA: hypothetical protein VM914_01815 [Pyrinomonadaceae bacterium]|nr:hypothetical protein [Pyrinomonadaceae bacterium]